VAGEKQPPVDRFIAGYQAGAKKADPKDHGANAYSQDFNDQRSASRSP
jgi:basic membrane protein A